MGKRTSHRKEMVGRGKAQGQEEAQETNRATR